MRRALASVAAQTRHPVEVIVIDDCSSPDKAGDIRAIVEDFNLCIPTRLLINESNRGANYSRNRGIFDAKGRYLAFLDSDDIWMPEKLQRQIDEIESAKKTNGRPVLSATGRYRVNSDGAIIVRQFGGQVLNPGKIRRSNFIGTLSSVIVETWIARHVWGFNEALPACQDWDFFIRLSDYVQYIGISDPLCVYVDHDEDRITLNNRKRLRAISSSTALICDHRWGNVILRLSSIAILPKTTKKLGIRTKPNDFWPSDCGSEIQE
ncbi:hypothetical protein AJ87_24205 [Rhizobium yanglingense]|nr:hypothetical protein AJ87_24205 [Rhizobium yanglingense]